MLPPADLPLIESMPRNVWLHRGALIALCLIVTLAANVSPNLASFGFQNDKLNHVLALAVITLMTIWALPGAGLVSIFVGLALFNAAIEMSQAVFDLGRTPSVIDWLTGVLASMVVLVLAKVFGKVART